jgi:hypothetical protein
MKLNISSVASVSESQLEWIASKSIRNCHAKGLHSILFDDTPGARLRCFIAMSDHDMYNNRDGYPLSIAIHPHHCDVRLIPIFGEMCNMTPVYRYQLEDCVYYKYKYDSPITGKQGKFTRVQQWSTKGCSLYLSNKLLSHPIAMKAKEEHTVYVPEGRSAAWYVQEGDEDATYCNYCWSNTDLTKFDFSPLYQPMDVAYLKHLLRVIGVEVTQ